VSASGNGNKSGSVLTISTEFPVESYQRKLVIYLLSFGTQLESEIDGTWGCLVDWDMLIKSRSPNGALNG